MTRMYDSTVNKENEIQSLVNNLDCKTVTQLAKNRVSILYKGAVMFIVSNTLL